MRRNGINPAAWVATLALLAFAGSVSAQTVDEIIDGNVKAIGGVDAIAKIKNVTRKGTIAADGAMGAMEGVMEVVMIPWKKAYQLMDLTIFQQKSGWNGEVAWQDGMMGLQKMEGEEAGQIENSASLCPFLGADGKRIKDATFEKLADEKIDDADHHVLQMTPAEGPVVKYFIDKKTMLVSQMIFDQDNPQMGPMTITAKASDYKEFGGVKMATVNTIELGDMMSLVTTFTETTINGDIDESIFEYPAPAASSGQ